MDLQTILQVVADFQQHAWWPLALVLVLYARKLVSPDSSFRINVPPRALHLVTASLTMLTVFVTAGVDATPLGTAAVGAIVAGIGAGFLDGLVTAIFGDPANVPGWAKTIVMLVDELGGQPPAQVVSIKPRGFVRPAAMLWAMGALLAGFVALRLLTACTPATAPMWQDIEKTIEADLENGTALSAIEAAVVAIDPALANDAAAVDGLIQAAIVVLETTGVLPSVTLPHAEAVRLEASKKADAALHKAGAAPPSPHGQRVLEYWQQLADSAQDSIQSAQSVMSAAGAR